MQKGMSRYWRVDRLTAVHTTATPYIATCDLPQGDPFHNAGVQTVAEGIESAPIKATLCIPVSLLADTVDAFGRDLHVLGETNEQPSQAVQVRIYAPEKRLRDWVLQQGGAVSVLYPRSLRCAVREAAEAIIAQYRE
jgi:predicted DNA-binding transcriptional regulator YafY